MSVFSKKEGFKVLTKMFPTIYGVALEGLSEEQSKIGSAGLVMVIVEGAPIP